MKRLILALILACAFSARATTVPMGMAQVAVDSNGNLLGLPTTGGTGATAPTTISAVANGVQFGVTGTVALAAATTGQAVYVSGSTAIALAAATTGQAVYVSGSTAIALAAATTGQAVYVSGSAAIAINAPTTGQAVYVSGSATLAVTCAACGTEATQATAANQALSYGALTNTATVTTYFTMNAVTAVTGTFATSYWYLTPSTVASLLVDNITSGPIYWVITNSATPPANTNTVRMSLQPGEKLSKSVKGNTLATGSNFIHWSSPNILTATAEYIY